MRRRYSEFASLRQALVNLHPTLIIPPIPEKHSISDYATKPTKAKEDVGIIELRQRMLATFLNRCRRMKEVREDGVWWRFLDPNASWVCVCIVLLFPVGLFFLYFSFPFSPFVLWCSVLESLLSLSLRSLHLFIFSSFRLFIFSSSYSFFPFISPPFFLSFYSFIFPLCFLAFHRLPTFLSFPSPPLPFLPTPLHTFLSYLLLMLSFTLPPDGSTPLPPCCVHTQEQSESAPS